MSGVVRVIFIEGILTFTLDRSTPRAFVYFPHFRLALSQSARVQYLCPRRGESGRLVRNTPGSSALLVGVGITRWAPGLKAIEHLPGVGDRQLRHIQELGSHFGVE